MSDFDYEQGADYGNAPTGTGSRSAVPDAVTASVKNAYAAQVVRRKDHIVAGFFAIFLGMFGMHKFYLGYNKAAFVMLAVSVIGSIVTFGLAGAVVWVIAVVEGIIYLTKSPETFNETYVCNQREWF